jgi:hypothetical protein
MRTARERAKEVEENGESGPSPGFRSDGPDDPVARGEYRGPVGENEMDPNATLQGFIDAAIDGDVNGMEEHYTALCEWFLRGGFCPEREKLG